MAAGAFGTLGSWKLVPKNASSSPKMNWNDAKEVVDDDGDMRRRDDAVLVANPEDDGAPGNRKASATNTLIMPPPANRRITSFRRDLMMRAVNTQSWDFIVGSIRGMLKL
jgi:hypothetical protein